MFNCIFLPLGALSDVNSLYNDGPLCDGDDTSVSSRASSRIFDDAMLSYDALSAYYHADYDNFKGPPSSSGRSSDHGGVGAVGGFDDDSHHQASGRTSGASGNKVDTTDDECLDKLDVNMRLDNANSTDAINFQDIRSVTESITLNFGSGRLETDLDSDV